MNTTTNEANPCCCGPKPEMEEEAQAQGCSCDDCDCPPGECPCCE